MPAPSQRMVLAWILIATVAGGVLSVLAAALLTLAVLTRLASKLVSFAVGVLLASALLDLLPEALTLLSGRVVGAVLLTGLMLFFALEKLALWRHDHGSAGHPIGSMIVLGDGLHNFVDGVLIATVFLQDTGLGIATTIAVIVHEIPQELGDFMILLSVGYRRSRALALNALSGGAMVLGGVLGYLSLQQTSYVIPYFLALAAASFLYIAIADLVPMLQRDRRPTDFALQLGCLAGGVGLVSFAHG